MAGVVRRESLGFDGSAGRPGGLTEEMAMSIINPATKTTKSADLLLTAAVGAGLLRLTLAVFWIVHWWYKVGFRGMPVTENFFMQNGLSAWLAWFDISFEVVVTFCLVLGL